jgi:hypothetical protein
MADVQTLVDQIRNSADQIQNSPRKAEIMAMLQQVLAMLQPAMPAMPPAMPAMPQLTPEQAAQLEARRMKATANRLDGYVSNISNPLKWGRADALSVINAENYDSMGNRIPGKILSENWSKGQDYLRANKGPNGAMLRFNGTKYYGGRRRRRTRRR